MRMCSSNEVGAFASLFSKLCILDNASSPEGKKATLIFF